MKLSRYCSIVENNNTLLLANTKNGSIILFNENIEEIKNDLNNIIPSIENKKYFSSLVMNGFLVENSIDEVVEAKNKYLIFSTNVNNNKYYFGVTIQFFNNNEIMNDDNIIYLFDTLYNYAFNNGIMSIVIKIIINSEINIDIIASEILKLSNKCNKNSISMELKIQFENIFIFNLIDSLHEYISNVIINNYNNNIVKNTVEQSYKYENINYIINMICKVDDLEQFYYEEDFVDNIKNNILIDREDDNNIGCGVLNEVINIDNRVVQTGGLSRMTWLKPGGLICEYCLPHNIHITSDLKVYGCSELKKEIGDIDNLNLACKLKQLKEIDDRCYECKWFYLCMGNHCLEFEDSRCPTKIYFINDYFKQLLDYFVEKGFVNEK